MLATFRDDTWNVLNMQHITSNSKRWDYSDTPGGGHTKIKGPAHMTEGGHHLGKAPSPHPQNQIQVLRLCLIWSVRITQICSVALDTWARFLSLARRKLRLCSANHSAGYFSNLACHWLSIVWAYSEQETENGPRLIMNLYWSFQKCRYMF